MSDKTVPWRGPVGGHIGPSALGNNLVADTWESWGRADATTQQFNTRTHENAQKSKACISKTLKTAQKPAGEKDSRAAWTTGTIMQWETTEYSHEQTCRRIAKIQHWAKAIKVSKHRQQDFMHMRIKTRGSKSHIVSGDVCGWTQQREWWTPSPHYGEPGRAARPAGSQRLTVLYSECRLVGTQVHFSIFL